MIEGTTYQAKSGQWSWRIYDEDGDICAGSGYSSEESAEQAMNDELSMRKGEQ